MANFVYVVVDWPLIVAVQVCSCWCTPLVGGPAAIRWIQAVGVSVFIFFVLFFEKMFEFAT